jgi:hypothetical protein
MRNRVGHCVDIALPEHSRNGEANPRKKVIGALRLRAVVYPVAVKAIRRTTHCACKNAPNAVSAHCARQFR